MMVIDNKYEIGDHVYLKHDQDQLLRVIIAVIAYKSGELMYKLACASNYSEHYDFEISREKNLVNA